MTRKASRFLEELPGDPALYERWQLEDPGGAPALGAAASAAVLPAMAMPRLFGPAPGEDARPAGGDGGEGEGGEEVPF